MFTFVKQPSLKKFVTIKDRLLIAPPPVGHCRNVRYRVRCEEGAVSRRINIQHRLVYQVPRAEKTVKVIRMWTYYE